MLSAKTKGLYIERGRFSTLAAVTSSMARPFQIERLVELPMEADAEEVRTFIASLMTSKGARFVPAQVAVYPKSRFFRRHSVDTPARMKEPAFFTELIQNQFRVDTEKNAVIVLNAIDGTAFDATKSLVNQKEIFVCGALVDELNELQDGVVGQGIFPESLQLGSVSAIGGLLDYGRHIKLRRPVLLLEIGLDRSNLFIVTQDRLDLCRPIPHGLDSMLPIIQSELGLKDEESARKLLYSNTFDFTETGASLLRKLLKELQSSMGFYEVQTGQSIGHLIVQLLPENLGWIRMALSKSLGIKPLRIDFKGWLEARSISMAPELGADALDHRWLGLLSMMPDFSTNAEASAPTPEPVTADGKEE